MKVTETSTLHCSLPLLDIVHLCILHSCSCVVLHWNAKLLQEGQGSLAVQGSAQQRNRLYPLKSKCQLQLPPDVLEHSVPLPLSMHSVHYSVREC